MRRLRALAAGLPADAAIHRFRIAEPAAPPTARPRRTSSFDEIRKIGGKVIDIRRGKAS